MPNILSFRPPESQRKLLRQKAKELGHTVNQLLILIVWDWLKNNADDLLRESNKN